MTTLVIRYVNGNRHFSLDHREGRVVKDINLHDAVRERRIELPLGMEGVPLRKIIDQVKGLWDAADQAEARDQRSAASAEDKSQ